MSHRGSGGGAGNRIKQRRGDRFVQPPPPPMPKEPKRERGRPPASDDATRNLQPDDEQQTAPKGTRIGKLEREKVLGDFRKIMRDRP